MNASNLLLTAVTLQRDGMPPHDIADALVDIARRNDLDCQRVCNFDGRVELVFADGHCLYVGPDGWDLRQQERVAPLYAEFMHDFSPLSARG